MICLCIVLVMAALWSHINAPLLMVPWERGRALSAAGRAAPGLIWLNSEANTCERMALGHWHDAWEAVMDVI